MESRDAQARRLVRERERQLRRARLAAFGSLIAVAAITAAIFLGSGGGSGSHTSTLSSSASSHPTRSATTTAGSATQPATASVPILVYHVINVPPPGGGASQDLYVPAAEFSAQMDQLHTAGWHAVTLNQLQAAWAHGTSLGSGKPIVITFDGGYASQYTNALPVLKRMGWVGVVNIQVNGRSSADGGMTDAQVRGLVAAGWELDSAGASQDDLTTVDAAQLSSETTTARQTLQSRYQVPVHWFSYPLGRYDPTVEAAVHAAGYVGATTLVPGWANPHEDRYRLPRLQVTGGTTTTQLMSDIAAAQQDAAPPDTSP